MTTTDHVEIPGQAVLPLDEPDVEATGDATAMVKWRDYFDAIGFPDPAPEYDCVDDEEDADAW